MIFLFLMLIVNPTILCKFAVLLKNCIFGLCIILILALLYRI